MSALLLMLACKPDASEVHSLRVCGYSELLEQNDNSGIGFGYRATVQETPVDPPANVDPACEGGGELHVVTEHGVPFSFYWTTDAPFMPDFDLQPGQTFYFFYKAGIVDEGNDEARPAGSLVVRDYVNGNPAGLLGVIHDAPLSPTMDYPEVEVRPGEVVDSTLTWTDYAIVFDGDDFVAVDPGTSAASTVAGIDRIVGNVSARGDEAGPTRMSWAIWAP